MRADALAKRRDLIAAARRLYATHDTEVSLRSIAEEAGVGIATLYRHFPTPLDLILGIADEIGAAIIDISRRWGLIWDEDPEASWRGFADEIAALRLGALVPRLIAAGQITAFPTDMAGIRAQTMAAVDDILARAKHEGLVREDVSAFRFHIGLAAMNRPLPEPALRELPDQHEWLTEVYLRGLRPDPDRPVRRGRSAPVRAHHGRAER